MSQSDQSPFYLTSKKQYAVLPELKIDVFNLVSQSDQGPFHLSLEEGYAELTEQKIDVPNLVILCYKV